MMPVYQAALLVLALIALLWLSGRLRLHPFLGLFVVAVAYGLAADMSITFIGQSFTSGFAQTIDAVGLVIVAGHLAATFAARSGAARRLGSWRPGALLPLGLVAGIAASAPAAFALLAPMRRAVAGDAAPAGTLLLALALLAGHGLLLPAPGPIAAAAILRAELPVVLAIGLPVAIVTALAGWLYVGCLAPRSTAAAADLPPPTDTPPPLRGAWAVVLPVGLPLALLAIQSIGLIPSEPLGGGHTRELLIGVGRPAFLLFAAAAAALLLAWRFDATTLSERGWVGEALLAAASLVLVTGAAGGFAKVLQNTGMPELMADRLLGLPVGLLLPFLVAAAMKILQGSSLVAVITAAGMLEPLLAALGLDSGVGRALAVIAIGAGAVTASHVNDPLFWLVAGEARLTPGRTLTLFAGGSLVQGAVAAVLVLAVGAALL